MCCPWGCFGIRHYNSSTLLPAGETAERRSSPDARRCRISSQHNTSLYVLTSPDLCFLADYEEEARRSIPHAHFEWISEGAADEETLRANEGAWCSPGLELMPRGAVDVGTVDLSVELTAIGSTLSWPVLVAPTSYQKLAHPDGEVATATAAARCDTCFVASHAMSCTSEVSPTAALPTHHARNCSPL
jgi:hypothetical protein